MFTWLGTIFHTIATSLVTGLVAVGLVSAPLPDMATTSTPVPSVDAAELATTTVSEIDQLREQLEHEKAARAKSESDLLQTQKKQAETKAAQAEAEAKRLQAELDSVKNKTVVQQNQAQTPQGILCNGQYWAACPTGQSFVCPVTGNAYCTSISSQQDAASAANAKVELISMANRYLQVLKSNADFIKNELAFVNEIQYQLIGVTGGYQIDQEATSLIKQASEIQETSFNQYDAANKKQMNTTETLVSYLSSAPLSEFNSTQSGQTRMTLTNLINTATDTLYKMKSESAQYRGIVDSYMQILQNLY